MPVTLAHPAAVLPLRRFERYVSVTGLIMGSIAPDFEYFMRFRFLSEFSHTLAGVFWFDLPVAILLSFLFHLVVKNNLISSLPDYFASRLAVCRLTNWTGYFKNNYLIVIFSALIGIGTHLLWDSFTHKQAYFVKQIDFLKFFILIGNTQVYYYKILQYLSGLAGGIYMVYVFDRLNSEETYTFTRRGKALYRTGLGLVTVLGTAVRFATGLKLVQYNSTIISMMSSFMIGLFIMGLFHFPKKPT